MMKKCRRGFRTAAGIREIHSLANARLEGSAGHTSFYEDQVGEKSME